MAPRNYRLGKRTEAIARTRERIVAAAMELYQEQGIGGTSMQEVARRADVAPGTVLNHFPSPESLTQAVIAHLMVDLGEPSPDMFEGLQTIRERVGLLVRELRSVPAAAAERRKVSAMGPRPSGSRRLPLRSFSPVEAMR